ARLLVGFDPLRRRSIGLAVEDLHLLVVTQHPALHCHFSLGTRFRTAAPAQVPRPEYPGSAAAPAAAPGLDTNASSRWTSANPERRQSPRRSTPEIPPARPPRAARRAAPPRPRPPPGPDGLPRRGRARWVRPATAPAFHPPPGPQGSTSPCPSCAACGRGRH